MIRAALLAGFSALIAAPAVSAAPVTLEMAVQRALGNSPSVSQAEAGVEHSLAGVDAARAGQGATLGVQAQIGVSHTDFTNDTISQEPAQIGIQAEWPVWTSGANLARVRAAGLTSDAAKSSLNSVREQVALQAVEAFSNAWLAEQVIRVGESRVETLRMRLEETNSRFEQGLVTRTDTALNEARLATAKAEQAANYAQLAVAMAKLERFTGLQDMELLSPLAGAVQIVPDSYEVALEDMLQVHPALKAANDMVEAADFKLREVQGRFGPKVSVKARAFTGEDTYFFFPDPITEVGAFVTFEMPLYTSGLKEAGAREALAGRAQATARAREVRLTLTESLAGIWGDLAARRLAVNAARQAEQAAALAAEGAQKEFDAGLRTLVDSLDAEDEYRQAQTERLRSETNLLVAKARLLSLMSSLEAEFRN